MQDTRPMEVVFLTNFADFCYRSIPAVAQMADDFSMRLTIVHTTLNQTPSIEDRIKLESFFPEADAYPNCRRVALKCDPLDAVRRLTMTHPVDLLIVPASDPLGLPRLWHRSLRARLLRELRIPLWTMDRLTHSDKLRRAPRKVGCWIDFHNGWTDHIAFARQYAGAVGGELHLLHTLPETSEGILLLEDRPLTEASVIDTVTAAIGRSTVPTHVHVVDSDSRRTRRKLLQKTGVDIVFAGDLTPQIPDWLAPKPRLMNESVCPVVHVPVDTPVPVWNLTRPRTVAQPVYRMAFSPVGGR